MDKIKKTNNHVFHYREFGNKNQDVVILLHGYADSAEMFNPLGQYLKEKYHVIALDLPMIHQQKKIENVTSLAHYVNKFATSLKLSHFSLVGFSLGGLVSIEYSHIYPNKVKELFLLNSFPQLLINRPQFMIYKVIKPMLMSKTFCKFLSLFKKRNQSVKPNFISVFGTMFNVIDAKLINKFISLPMEKTIVFFKDDRAINPRRFRKFFKSLNCNLVIFPHGGHAQDQETYWKNIEKLWLKN